MHISDGSPEQIQVIIPSFLCNEECTFNSAVEISGKIVQSPKPNQPLEIQGDTLKVVGTQDLEKYPFGPRKYYPPEYLRQQIHLRPKTNIYAAILRLSSLITISLQNTLIQDEFISVSTPILTSNDCEGAGEVFLVRPASDELCREMGNNGKLEDSYFNKKVFLTVSGQLHLEAIAGYRQMFTFTSVDNISFSILAGEYLRFLRLGQRSVQRTLEHDGIWQNLECSKLKYLSVKIYNLFSRRWKN